MFFTKIRQYQPGNKKEEFLSKELGKLDLRVLKSDDDARAFRQNVFGLVECANRDFPNTKLLAFSESSLGNEWIISVRRNPYSDFCVITITRLGKAWKPPRPKERQK